MRIETAATSSLILIGMVYLLSFRLGRYLMVFDPVTFVLDP